MRLIGGAPGSDLCAAGNSGIDKSGCYGTFSLCYDTGDSPAGELYLNVSFDEQFVPSPKVGYSNLYHCDRDGVYLYIDAVSGQLADAIGKNEG